MVAQLSVVYRLTCSTSCLRRNGQPYDPENPYAHMRYPESV